jgi:hypothetical protein
MQQEALDSGHSLLTLLVHTPFYSPQLPADLLAMEHVIWKTQAGVLAMEDGLRLDQFRRDVVVGRTYITKVQDDLLEHIANASLNEQKRNEKSRAERPFVWVTWPAKRPSSTLGSSFSTSLAHQFPRRRPSPELGIRTFLHCQTTLRTRYAEWQKMFEFVMVTMDKEDALRSIVVWNASLLTRESMHRLSESSHLGVLEQILTGFLTMMIDKADLRRAFAEYVPAIKLRCSQSREERCI